MTRAIPLLGLCFLIACGDDDDTRAMVDASVPGADATTGPPDDAGGTPDQSTPTGECELTDWEQMMLDDHNRWRAEVDPPAAGMHRVYWDEAIAANAAAWVASCDPEWPHSPDSEREGIGYEALGENLHYCAGTGCAENPEVLDESGRGNGDGWWEERLDYDHATMESSGVTGHYLAMASSNTYAIGCATQRCPAPGPGGWDDVWWWTICQYGPRGQGYWVGTRPYDEGAGGLVEPDDAVFEAHTSLCR